MHVHAHIYEHAFWPSGKTNDTQPIGHRAAPLPPLCCSVIYLSHGSRTTAERLVSELYTSISSIITINLSKQPLPKPCLSGLQKQIIHLLLCTNMLFLQANQHFNIAVSSNLPNYTIRISITQRYSIIS